MIRTILAAVLATAALAVTAPAATATTPEKCYETVTATEAYDEPVPAVPGAWWNWSPNHDTGPFEGPPSFPTDERGTWQGPHTEGGPDGEGTFNVSHGESGNSSWFHRDPGTPATVIHHDAVTEQREVPCPFEPDTQRETRTVTDVDCDAARVYVRQQERTRTETAEDVFGPWSEWATYETMWRDATAEECPIPRDPERQVDSQTRVSSVTDCDHDKVTVTTEVRRGVKIGDAPWVWSAWRWDSIIEKNAPDRLCPADKPNKPTHHTPPADVDTPQRTVDTPTVTHRKAPTVPVAVDAGLTAAPAGDDGYPWYVITLAVLAGAVVGAALTLMVTRGRR